MTQKKKDFYGKEVTDAIKSACEELNAPQEQLEIEVIDTGSTGIFGLIRKKAHITAFIKGAESTADSGEKRGKSPELSETPVTKKLTPPKPVKTKQKEKEQAKEPPVKASAPLPEQERIDVAVNESKSENADDDDTTPDDENRSLDEDSSEEITEEALQIIKNELQQLLELMGYTSPVEVSSKGSSVFCHVGDEHEEILTGQDGKTLDSIQYLLRKIIARKVPNRLRLTVDVGNYREKRLEELKVRAAELAEKVKANGKTEVIAALSPSERRVIHMSLQEDKEIRSRSVGDGLFKKILIYKPGKGGKPSGRKRNNSRGRRGGQNRKKNGQSS